MSNFKTIGVALLAALLFASSAFAQVITPPPKSAILTWTPNVEPDLKGYKLYGDNLLCSQLGPKSFIIELGKVSTYTAPIPSTAFQYSFNLTAIDLSTNESLRSNCVEKTFYVPPTLGSFVLGTLTPNSIQLTLASVADGAGGTAKYDVRWAVAPALTNFGWGSATNVPACLNPGSCVIPGLPADTAIEIQFLTYRTTNGANVFTPLSAVTVVTTTKDALPPGVPKDLKVTERPTEDSAIIGWIQPGAEPDVNRVDRLDADVWVPETYALGSVNVASVSLPLSGRRIFRACAVALNGEDFCNEREGVWITR